MNRLATSLLGAMMIAGILYRPSGPPTSGGASGSAQIRTMGSKQVEQPGTGGVGALPPCVDTSEGPWKALEDSLKASEKTSSDPFLEIWNQYHDSLGGGSVRALIVTVPDPVHTRLALDFDRAIDSITAAAAADYSLDRFWLPWNDNPAPDEPNCYWRLQEQLETERREQEPGLLIFRRKPSTGGGTQPGAIEDLFWVFLVGESPVSGIDKIQFANAVKHVQSAGANSSCTRSACTIDVAGPTFSGSVDSLKLILSKYAPPGPLFRLTNFSVTGQDEQKTLQEFCGTSSTSGKLTQNQAGAEAPESNWRPCASFDTTVESDQDMVAGLKKYLISQNLDRPELQPAYISESETAYGERLLENREKSPKSSIGGQDLRSAASSDNGQQSGHLEYRFPRGIARLREAYGQNLTAVAASGNEKSNPVPRQLLPLVLNEAPLNEESPPDFAKSQTPITEELQMLALAAELRHDQVELAGIAATDPLDVLFVLQLLHRTNPEVQLFILDWDLLFLRAQDEVPPEGLLAVSPYPLFEGEHEWSGTYQFAPHRFLPSRYSTALYNAMLLLLNAGDSALGTAPPKGLGKRPWLSRSGSRPSEFSPPIWLSIVGRNGYWPVSVLSSPLKSDPRTDGGEPLPHVWEVAWGISTILTMMVIAAFVRGQFVDPAKSHRWLENFNLTDAGQKPAWAQVWSLLQGDREATAGHDTCLLKRGFWLLMLMLALWISQMILAVPFFRAYVLPGSMLFSLGAWRHGFSTFALASLTQVSVLSALQICIVFLSLVLLWVAATRKSGAEAWYYRVAIPVALAVAVTFGTWWVWTVRRHDYYGLFFSYRSAQFTSGVSPALPLLLLGFVLVAAAWTELDRLAKDVARPYLPVPEIATDLGVIEERLESNLHKTIYNWPAQLSVLVLFAFAWFISAYKQGAMVNIESRWFAHWYVLAFAGVMLLVLNQGLRFYLVWQELEGLLARLEQLPFREAFTRLPKQFSTAAIWQQGGARVNYQRLTRSVESLRALNSLRPANASPVLPITRFENDIQEIFARESGRVRPGHDLITRLEWRLRATAEIIARKILTVIWQSGASDSTDEEENENLSRRGRELRLHYDRQRILAEEFLALRYVAYIWNTCIQMRFMLFVAFTGFILAYLSVESYPFTAHHALVTLLIILLIGLLGGMISVFVRMDRDSILARLADREPGKLDKDFYIRVLSYVALPLFTVIAAQFPSVARFLFSWAEPALQMAK